MLLQPAQTFMYLLSMYYVPSTNPDTADRMNKIKSLLTGR